LDARQNGPATPGVGELVEPRDACPGERELRRHEEAIEQHEQQCLGDLHRVRQRPEVVCTPRMLAPRRAAVDGRRGAANPV
jgi:hypothetical protein